jgi:hypothetical protein
MRSDRDTAEREELWRDVQRPPLGPEGRLTALTDEPASVEWTAAIRPAADINPLARRRCLG